MTLAVAAVLCAGRPEPAAAAAPAPETAVFSMYCYWTGEATVGRVPGVLRTRIGDWGGEIVEVVYDPARTDPKRLADALRRNRSFYAMIVPDRQARDRALAFLDPGDVDVRSGRTGFIEPKHSLRTRHPELYFLDLTEGQAIALNSWSYFGGPMPDVLADGQKALLGKVKAKLAAGRPGLRPARAGIEREEYRRELLAWLGE